MNITEKVNDVIATEITEYQVKCESFNLYHPETLKTLLEEGLDRIHGSKLFSINRCQFLPD